MNVESFPSLLSLDILTALFQNVVLMLAFAFVYTILHPYIVQLGQAGLFLTGALLGLFAILLPPLSIVDGVFVDSRTLLFITAGAMSGRRSALAAVLVFAPYRLWEGGLGVLPSILSTLAAAGLGVVIYQRYGRLKPYYDLRDFLFMGVIAAACRLLASFALPWDLALSVLYQSVAAILVIYPVTMALVGTLFTREIRRVDMEASLRTTKLAFEMSPNAVFITDFSARIKIGNAAAARLLGESNDPADLENRQLADFLTQESWRVVQREMQHASVQAASPLELSARTFDGWVLPVNFSIAVLRSKQGILEGYVAVMSDVSAQKRAEEQIEEERALLRTVIDTIPDYVYVKDSYSHFVVCNEAVARSFGVDSSAALLGRTDADFYPPDVAQRFREEEKSVMASGQPLVNVEEPKRSPDGSLHGWVLTTKLPLYDLRGNILGLVGVGRDITDRKQAETKEIEIRLEREKVDLVRNFLSDASHDLRTPLSVMNTSLYLLGRTIPADQKHHVETLEAQTARFHRIIEDMLMLSRLELADVEFELTPLDVNTLVRDALWEKRADLQAKQHELHFEPAPGELFIMAESAELRRALGYLLDNAIIYTPERGVIQIATQRCDGDVICEIRDSGIGIPADDLPHIFERFYRVDKARSTDTGGSGLGLTIARKIVEVHHGRIEADSVLGQGSTFRIVLPLAPHDASSTSALDLLASP